MNTQKNILRKLIICIILIGFVFNQSQAQMLQLENEIREDGKPLNKKQKEVRYAELGNITVPAFICPFSISILACSAS